MNTEKKLVSIITPSFNSEKYIRDTIESILNQTYGNVEYIIVDAGSTDNTVDIIKSYEDKFQEKGFIYKWISESDNGMYDAINKGFKMATGDIFSYINSDDYYFPNTIDNIVKRYSIKNFDLLYGNTVYVDEDNNEIFRYKGVMLSKFFIKALNRLPFSQQSCFWSKDIFIKVGGFDTSYQYVADTDFFYKIISMRNSVICKQNEYVACFRIHKDAISSKYIATMAKEHDNILNNQNIVRLIGIVYIVELYVKLMNFKNLIIKKIKGY